jgi:hypothetical protein
MQRLNMKEEYCSHVKSGFLFCVTGLRPLPFASAFNTVNIAPVQMLVYVCAEERQLKSVAADDDTWKDRWIHYIILYL